MRTNTNENQTLVNRDNIFNGPIGFITIEDRYKYPSTPQTRYQNQLVFILSYVQYFFT